MSGDTCQLAADLFDDESADARERLACHLNSCESCRSDHADWTELQRLAAGLREVPQHSLSWQRIGLAIQQEARRAAPKRRAWVPLAAAALLALLLFYPWQQQEAHPLAGAVLAAAELSSLEQEQQILNKQLQRLEPAFRERLASGGDQAALVSGQLAFLAESLERCRQLLLGNPDNAGLRRALVGGVRRRVRMLQDFLND